MSSKDLPVGAVREATLAGGVVLYSIVDLMPKNTKTRLGVRPVSDIERIYFHHSGRLGASGWKGPYNSARYVVSRRGFPAAAYHFWFPYKPVQDSKGNYVVYRLNRDRSRCWHTGGAANGHGIGVCFQANLNKLGPSDFQRELFEAFTPWAIERYSLSGDTCLSYHSEAGRFGGKAKPACPGPMVTEWVNEYRSNL